MVVSDYNKWPILFSIIFFKEDLLRIILLNSETFLIIL